MNTKIVLGLAAVALGITAFNSFSPALAYRGDPKVRGPNFTEERHQTNLTAFAKGDYRSWLANMSGRGATRFVNESNFKEFAQAQLDAQKGDYTKLNAFRAKYGMGQRNGQGRGQGMGMGNR